MMIGADCIVLQLLDLLELSNSFDALVFRRVRVMYFYFWGDRA
jgi:hypothetical protein